jgi:hypothetical protein
MPLEKKAHRPGESPPGVEQVDGVDVHWPSEEQRVVYRTVGSNLGVPNATLERGDIRVPVAILDIASRGAGLILARTQGPLLRQVLEGSALGELRLVLQGGLPDGTIVLPATYCAVSPYGDAIRLSVSFLVSAKQRRTLTDRLKESFNQRCGLRVAPDPGVPVGVVVHLPGRTRGFVGVTVEVSVRGCRVALVGNQAAIQLAGAQVVVAFTFPGTDAPSHVRAGVVWTETGGSRPRGMPSGGVVTQVGVTFEWADAPDDGKNPARVDVTRFVVDRQLAWLQAQPDD